MNTVKIGKFELVEVSRLKGSALNREVDLKHVNRMANKIMKEGFTQPITIAPSGHVIEGAHRAMASKQLNLDKVPCYVIDWVNVEEDETYLESIIKMNNSNKSWQNEDYLKSYSNINEDYAYVLDKFNTSNLSVGLVVNCYFKKANKDFKSGKGYIEDKTLSDELVKALNGLRETHGKDTMQAYALRDVINSFNSSPYKSLELITYLREQLNDLAEGKDSRLQNIKEFKGCLKKRLDIFNKRQNK
jgi:ParB-like chromosome segregation protein Spo0J